MNSRVTKKVSLDAFLKNPNRSKSFKNANFENRPNRMLIWGASRMQPSWGISASPSPWPHNAKPDISAMATLCERRAHMTLYRVWHYCYYSYSLKRRRALASEVLWIRASQNSVLARLLIRRFFACHIILFSEFLHLLLG